MKTDSDNSEHSDMLNESIDENSTISRVQLILAEKRTSLSVLRSGIALLTLPMSIVALLVATSEYYDVAKTLHLVIPLFLLNSFLVTMGILLIVRAWRRIKKQDQMIELIKKRAPNLSKLINEVGGLL